MIAVETELFERWATIPEGGPQVEIVETFPLGDGGQPVVLLAVLPVVRLRKIRKDGEEDRECLARGACPAFSPFAAPSR